MRFWDMYNTSPRTNTAEGGFPKSTILRPTRTYGIRVYLPLFIIFLSVISFSSWWSALVEKLYSGSLVGPVRSYFTPLNRVCSHPPRLSMPPYHWEYDVRNEFCICKSLEALFRDGRQYTYFMSCGVWYRNNTTWFRWVDWHFVFVLWVVAN